MKRWIAIIIFAFGINAIIAQTKTPEQTDDNISLDPAQVPTVAVSKFINEFPRITPAWRTDAKNYKANYIDPNTKLGRAIIYDKDGNVLRRENEVDNMTYPSSIADYYNKNYPGETFLVWSSQDKSSGKPLYYSSRNTETTWFDQNGKIIPERKAEKAIEKKK